MLNSMKWNLFDDEASKHLIFDILLQQMNAMAAEYLAMKDSLNHHATLMENLQDENLKLKSLAEENLEDKKKRDAQLDEIGREVYFENF